MIGLSSNLQNREEAFVNIRGFLETYGFVLGGNWDYDRGFFDCKLDEAGQVWLRLPFRVTHGTFDGESDDSDAVVQFGEPFVLKHVYQSRLDGEASPKVAGSLVDQFQDPVHPDAAVDSRSVEAAGSLLQRVEAGLGDMSNHL